MKRKGFTLIELLAVIVILAIITLIGATTVLPYIRNSRKQAFMVEVNEAASSAKNAMKLIDVGKIDDNDYRLQKNNVKPPVYYWCFSLEDLVNLGLWTKDAGAVSGDKKTYDGWVRVETDSNGNYYYTVGVKNGSYYIKRANISDAEDKVKQGDAEICACSYDTLCAEDVLVPIDRGGGGLVK